MVGALTKADVYTDGQGLSELRLSAHNRSPEALKAVAQQFEALFTQMMLKSMRDANAAMGGDALFDNQQSELYRDMYDKQLSLELSKGQGLGLADLMVRQLQGSLGNNSAAADAKAAAATAPLRMPTAASAPAKPKEAAGFDSPEAFIQTLWPQAQRAGKQLGVDPRALLAQAALETGWGRAVIRRADGSSSYNLFNIKADDRWSGARALKTTVEYRDGVARQERAPFRAYGSYQESFEDYVRFLQSQPRYQPALENADNPTAFIRALHQAGYATDPAYAQKVQDILGRDLLAQARGLKVGDERTIS